MPKLAFDPNVYDNSAYNLPSSLLQNMFSEKADEPSGWPFRFVPTPGLKSFSLAVGATGRGCTQSDAVASGDIIKVFDTTVHRVDSVGTVTQITGAILNDGKPVRFANSQSQVVLNSAGKVYTVTGSAVTEFTANLTAAGASGAIIGVAVINNRHLYVEDNSGRLFYSNPGDATTIAGFITAEKDPDQLRGVMVIGASVLLFGNKLTEVWRGTDSVTTPLIARSGFILKVGIISTDAKAQIGGVAYFIGNDGVKYEWAGGAERPISPSWMDVSVSSLSAADKAMVRLTAHDYDGRSFIKTHIPNKGDYLYGTKSRTLHKRKDLGDEVPHWGFDYFVKAFGEVYVQRLSNGGLCKLDSGVSLEDGNPVRRVTSAIFSVDEPLRVNNVIIEGQPGVGLDITSGLGSDPVCNFRVAYDARIFNSPIQRQIGKFGEHRWRPVIGSLGTIKPPRVLIELSYGDPVGWVVYGITFNGRAY